MIHDHCSGTPLPEDLNIILLEKSPFSFYLTGSYYFDCAHEDSDIDFMVQNSGDVEGWLRKNGFTKDVLEYAPRLGALTHRVLQRGNVQVQLATDVALKRRVRDFIRSNSAEWHRAADRDERMWMWDTVASVLAPEKYCPSIFSLQP